IVREIDKTLEVLDFHSILTPINLKATEANFNSHAGYYPHQNKNSDITFQKETRLENTMKCVAYELNNKIDESELLISNRILLEWHDTEEDSNKLLEIIEENISKAKLRSTILIDSKQYLLLVFLQPCTNCGNIQVSKYTYIVDTIGFAIKSQIICHLYCEIIENDNEPRNIRYSKAVSAAALVGGFTYYSLQNIFAYIGITSQSCRKSYYLYQAPLFSYLVANAKESTIFWLEKSLEIMKQKNANYLPVNQDIGKTINLHEENFKKSSRQMEHCILIAVLNEVEFFVTGPIK
ncbi:13170_t:CDS:2, partial [Racocetra fulgida]